MLLYTIQVHTCSLSEAMKPKNATCAYNSFQQLVISNDQGVKSIFHLNTLTGRGNVTLDAMVTDSGLNPE